MSKYEAPKYEVIKKDNKFEIRLYEAFDTTSVDENKLAGYSGFNLLFSYISGNNKSNEKISMTVPVINEFKDESMSMEFVVPSKYKGSDIPIPLNPNLVTKHYPKHHAASISFRGRSTKNHVERMKNQLIEWMSRNDVAATGPFRLARFNPPFTPPCFRHNEIIVDIKMNQE